MFNRLFAAALIAAMLLLCREARAQEYSFCYRSQCFPTLHQAEQALRQDPQYSNYGPLAVLDRTSVSTDFVYYHYKVPDQLPARWFAPDFAVPSFNNGTPGCTPSSPIHVKGCQSEEAALASALNTQAFYNYDIRSDFRLTGVYPMPFSSFTRSQLNGKDYGVFNFANVYGIVALDLWHPSYGDFRGFEFEAVGGMQSNPVKSYRISVEKRLTFECPVGFQPPYIELATYPGGDIYSFPWCRAKGGVPTISANFTQVASCAVNQNPCHPATGDKARTEVDFEFAGRTFARHYHSLGQLDDGGLSKGWSHSLSERVIPNSATLPVIVTRDGYHESISRIGTTNFYRTKYRTEGVFEIISGTGPVKYRFSAPNGEKKEFNAAGRLVAIRSSQEPLRDIELFYESDRLSHVVDATGKFLSFSYADNRLAQITLPNGSAISYAYDGEGQLASVDYDNGQIKHYHYGEPNLTTPELSHLLTGITSEDGQRYASFGYDASGRVTSSRLHASTGFVSSTQLDYVSADTVNVVTAEHGLKTYQFGPSPSRRPLSITDSEGTIANQFVSDRLTQTTDKKGVVTHYSYADGFLSETRHATGAPEQRRVVLTRNAEKRVVQRDVYGRVGASESLMTVERTAYDSLGRTAATCRVEPAVAAASSYICGSQPTAPLGVRQTLLIYCEQSDVGSGICPAVGLTKAVVSPAPTGANATTYTYYPTDDATCATAPTTCPHRKGDLWKVTNALGQVTETLRYDGAGRVLSVKDPNGVITDFEYHPRGWLTARKTRGANDASEADDPITRIEYWPTGLVKQVTQPDGAFTAYSYDAAHRLTDIADNAGNQIHYVLDNAGNRLQEDTKDAGGTLKRTLSRVYNQLGQLATQADAQANPTDFTFDANGNTDTVTDALGRVTDNDYDPLNRLARTLQDVGGIAAETTFQYDARDNLTKVTDPKGLDTAYTYNGLGDLTHLQSPDTGTTSYTYDNAGNRKTQTDARGVITQYDYDALSRLTGIVYPDAALNITYTYDQVPAACATGEGFAIGRLSTMTDGSGSTQYCYDRFGHLARKVQTTSGVTFVLRYAYTLAGQLQAMVYPDGTTVDYIRDAQGRTTEVGVTRTGHPRQVLLHQATYHPFGPVAGWSYGNGRQMTRSLDQDYRPLAVQDSGTGGLSLNFGFDAVGNLTQLTSGSPPPLTFVYDPLGRLTETRDGPTQAAIDTYHYDKTGNRTAHITAAGTNTYGYPTTNHRLTDVGGVIRGYDEAGNTLTIGAAKEFVYNAANRMSQVKQSGAVAMNYAYNGRGEQVRKHLGTSNTYTLYDEAGHWLGDYDNTGAPLQQALWMDDLPVGLLANGNQLHYIQPDHLGTPRVVIEVARDVPVWTWDAKGDAFGNTAPDQNPDGDADTFVFDMRFPGQRFDAVSGLNYNYFREYDPGSGRYIESDPLGIDGGVATYLYGFGNPTGVTDNFGLDGKPGFGDQINPAGIRGDGVKDYTNYFDSRFPKTMVGAAQVLKNRILKKVCDKFGDNASQLPALNGGADDIDIQPDMARFGDSPQSWYERNVQIGAFQIQTRGVSIKWDSPANMCSSCFSYATSMYVSENTGDNRIPGFKERNVKMGSWNISGKHCCGR